MVEHINDCKVNAESFVGVRSTLHQFTIHFDSQASADKDMANIEPYLFLKRIILQEIVKLDYLFKNKHAFNGIYKMAPARS